MRKYYLNDDYFYNIDCENKAYWLGFLMADGCMRFYPHKRTYGLSLLLKESDKKHIEKFQKDLNSNYPIGVRKNDNAYFVTYQSKKMLEDLSNLGCVPNKTFKLKLPPINDNLLNHFTRGYFDADGSIYKVSGKSFGCSFLGQEEFLTSLNLIFNRIGLYRPIENTYSGNVLRIRFQKKSDVKTIYDWMYSNANIYLDRKFDKFSLRRD